MAQAVGDFQSLDRANRRAAHVLTIQPWRRLSPAHRHAVETEAVSMPLPRPRLPR